MRFARPLTIALLSLAGVTAAQASPDTPQVDARQARHQARIAAGVADGSLTRTEAHQLRHQQRHIRQAERLAKADGTVTAEERHGLHCMQNRASRNIHRQRHDHAVRPHAAG